MSLASGLVDAVVRYPWPLIYQAANGYLAGTQARASTSPLNARRILDLTRCGEEVCITIIRVAAAALTVALSACAVIRIEAPSGTVQVERHWGVVSVQLAQSQETVVGQVRGLGMMTTPIGWSLGYTNQSWLLPSPECRLVMWVSASEQLESIRQLIGAYQDICVTAPNQQKERIWVR